MKEAVIRKKFKELCVKNGEEIWYPAKVKFFENDLFGVFDIIKLEKQGEVSFWQLTSLSNLSARKKKILNWLGNRKFSCRMYVAGYNKKKKEFKVIKI